MRICFYYEYKDLKGGYTTLIISLIKELYRQNKEILLFNYKNGLIQQELEKQNIEIEIVDIEQINWSEIDQIVFPSDVIIITSFLEILHKFFKVNPFIVYYDINFLITHISSYKHGMKFHFLGNKLVNKLIAHQSLIFMDDTGIANIKRVFKSQVAHPVYLPIPVSVPKNNYYLNKIKQDKNILNFTYVGRSVDWKMYPLKKIIEDCVAISKTINIHFSIVVDSILEFEKFIDLNHYKKVSNLIFSLYENMLPSELDEFLKQTSDIHFAMGTASLDAAKFGIPTILIDASSKPMPQDYSYRWLYESVGFNIGKLLDDFSVPKGVTMKELISSYLETNNDIVFSKRCYDHVNNLHSVEKVVPKLVEVCQSARFRIRDAKNLVPYYFRFHRILKSIFKRQKK